jgi:hypothetical protein
MGPYTCHWMRSLEGELEQNNFAHLVRDLVSPAKISPSYHLPSARREGFLSIRRRGPSMSKEPANSVSCRFRGPSSEGIGGVLPSAGTGGSAVDETGRPGCLRELETRRGRPGLNRRPESEGLGRPVTEGGRHVAAVVPSPTRASRADRGQPSTRACTPFLPRRTLI